MTRASLRQKVALKVTLVVLSALSVYSQTLITGISNRAKKMALNSATCDAECNNYIPSPTPKPYLRSSLARTMYNRMQENQALQRLDKNLWYRVDHNSLPDVLAATFLQFHVDAATQQFLDTCEAKSDWLFTQLWHLVAKAFLAFFLSQTSINGLLGRGSMFVLSEDQCRQLLQVSPTWKGKTMLDIGAGDGATTSQLAPLFEQVDVTEISGPMRSVLQSKGFMIKDVDSWYQSPGRYDLISILNVLDRCAQPVTLLQQAKAKLAPGGRLLIALVWPFKPYVETGGDADHQPLEQLAIQGQTFEEQLASLVHNVLEPLGFRLLRWSRVPYLCEGDLERSFYYLSDMVLTLTTL